ncbi:MAG TPA: hypothetical protein P5222_08780 [Candidatus Cloacimonadota bacterium]|nr:hypothetical protein [Candidatus Cloacimonadota bacterium]
MLKKYLILKKITKSTRAERLSRLIRAFLAGKISPKELEKQLETLYNRHGDARTTLNQLVTHNSELVTHNSELVTSPDPLYHQIYQLITATHPLRSGLRDDQIESYANTVSARAATTERLTEYQNRGVQKVKVVAYIDAATTDICRSMHGRIFEIPTHNSSLVTHNSELVTPSSFWTDNHHFSQTPTSQMRPFLPPYHYNCRTRVVPYIEPANPYDAALDRYHNLEPLQEKHLQAILEMARTLKFASQSLLDNHLKKHGHEFGVTSARQYLNLTKELINSPLTNAAMAISARDGSLNLYLWSPRQWQLNGEPVHNFAVFSLDNKCLKTFYPKSLEKIMANLDPEVHFKVVSLTNNLIRKGIKMVTEYDVKCYEDIIDYLEWQDGTDELEIVSRLEFEKEWDSITTELKLRIMKVDKIVLDRYADWHDDYLFKRYIDTIKARLAKESTTTRNS